MDIILAIALFLMAAGYAAVGLGGGTGYLALLSFWNHDPSVLRPLSWGLSLTDEEEGQVWLEATFRVRPGS